MGAAIEDEFGLAGEVLADEPPAVLGHPVPQIRRHFGQGHVSEVQVGDAEGAHLVAVALVERIAELHPVGDGNVRELDRTESRRLLRGAIAGGTQAGSEREEEHGGSDTC